MLGSILHSFTSLLLLKPPLANRRNLIFLAINGWVWASINFGQPGHFFNFLCFLSSFSHLCTVARDTPAFRWRQRSSPASKISQKREFLCLYSFGTPSCENFISCKTHKGPQEGFALNSPFIGQQIRPPKSHFKMKNDVLCRVFQTLSFRQSCAKRVENCLFQRFFQSRTSLSSFSPPLAQQVIRSTYIQSDSHLSVQSSR